MVRKSEVVLWARCAGLYSSVLCCLYSYVLCWALQVCAEMGCTDMSYAVLSCIEACCAQLYGILVVLSWVVQYFGGVKLCCTVQFKIATAKINCSQSRARY